MAIKTYEVEGVGSVRLQKRRGTPHLRISLTAHGDVRVSLPTWAPYRLGLEFVNNKRSWIQKHRSAPVLLQDGQPIGKAHRLVFSASHVSKRTSSRIAGNTIRITYPSQSDATSPAVQQAAIRGAKKALLQEAEALLPARLGQLAKQHGFTYRNVRLKPLATKWGSCDHRAEITLNSYLMTLPWELIDYVLLHELVHTKVLRHGEPFWREMARHVPDVQPLRKRLRAHRPTFNVL